MRRARERAKEDVQRALEQTLAKLKAALPFDTSLVVCWDPRADSKISG